MFKLDFTIESSSARNQFISQHDLSHLSKKELELCANYILWGKDADGTSSVDRKEIDIPTRFNSYKHRHIVSLDALLESPTFDEASLLNPTAYRNVKPTINKEKASTVKGMKSLWKTISDYERLLQNPKLSSKQRYLLKHQLIQLRRQQYYLMDSIESKLVAHKNLSTFYPDATSSHLSYQVLPRGIMSSKDDPIFKHPRLDPLPSKAPEHQPNAFDFTNSIHVYQLITNYTDLSDFISSYPDSPLHNLLWTLDYYIELAHLSPQQSLIVDCKKQKMAIKDIQMTLEQNLGIHHQENYISTIWNKVVKRICNAANLNYDEWLCKDYDRAWKRCSCCGEEKLCDPRNFMRKRNSTDGFTSRCKECERKKRTEGGE